MNVLWLPPLGGRLFRLKPEATDSLWRVAGALAVCLVVSALSDRAMAAQQGQPAAGAASKTPRGVAPVDFTGYWVSVITEDWRYRMVTPPKGDTASLPLNQAGVAAAKQWDPARDIAAGEQCRAFGAAGIMRLPVRLH